MALPNIFLLEILKNRQSEKMRANYINNFKLIILLLPIYIISAEFSFAFSNNDVVEIIESNNSRVIFELKPYKIDFEESFVNGKKYEIPKVKGCYRMLEPGKPELPVIAILLGIPLNADPTIKIFESHSTFQSRKNVLPSPELILTKNDQGKNLSQRFYLDKECYSQNRFYPAGLVEITSIIFFRHQRVARIEIHPLQYNPVTKELVKIDRLRFALFFNESQPLKKRSIKPGKSTFFENIYKNTLQNYQTARNWQQSAINRYEISEINLMDWYNPNNEYYKLSVEETGVYLLDYAYFDSLGIDITYFDPSTLKIFNKGQEIPLYVRGQEDGRFDQQDYLEFYGQQNFGDSTYYDLYTDTNIYWLTWDGEPGLRMKNRRSSLVLAKKVNEYMEQVYLEEERFYHHGDNGIDALNIEQVEGEGWVWRFLYAGNSEIVNIVVNNIAESDNLCQLDIKLRGTTLDQASPNHHVKVMLNDNFLGEEYFSNTNVILFKVSFPVSHLQQGENKLVISSVGDTGAEIDQFYLDWLKLKYPRQLVANNNYLEVTTSDDQKGVVKLTFWEFDDRNIQLFDLNTNSIIADTEINVGQRFLFKVISAGWDDDNFVQICINSQVVVSNGYRGHNLAVVDEVSGQLIAIKHFDTYISKIEADSMANYIQNLPQGRIVLAAIKDEGSENMTEAAHLALESLGSQFTRNVGYRESWALIGRKGASIGTVPEALKTYGNGKATIKDTLVLTGSGNKHYLIVTDTLRQPPKYLAFTQSGTKYPVQSEHDVAANLASTENGADLVIITHKQFLSSAHRLAQYRTSHNNLRVKVANVEDIYDEFNYGLLSPQAIKNFLKYAFSYWQSPAPAYVLLFGDASWDFKKNSSESIKENFVPTYGNPVSDNWYVCFDETNDFLPEMFVGRIPVESQEDAEIVIDKIIAYEQTPSDSWKKNILFVTGGFDNREQVMFINQSNFIIDHFVTPPPASCNALQINKTTEGYIQGEKKQEILDAINNNGNLWVNFIGHAGSNTWDLMFDHPDIEELTNQDKYPFITSMTCHTGRFANPQITSFGEHFLITENKGAVAFWGTTGWGYVFQDNVLLKNLFQGTLIDTIQLLGDATTFAKIKLWEAYGESIYNTSIIHQYTLIGDPVTDLALPVTPDITITPQDIKVTPLSPVEADSSCSIKIRIHNWGLATKDSLQIDVIDVQGNQNMKQIVNTITSPPLGLVDSLNIIWNLKDQAGQHEIRILLDPQNKIDEVNENNNSQNFSIYVYSSKVTISKPVEFQVVSPSNLVLQVNNPSILQKEMLLKSFQFEVDTTNAFTSSLLISSPIISQGKIITKWKLPDLLKETTYFWRCRSVEESEFGKWVSSSFTTTSNANDITWMQKHPAQYIHNQLDHTQYTDRGIQIQARRFVFQVESAGLDDGNFTIISVNSIPVLEQHRGHNIVVIIPNTGHILTTKTFDTYDSQEDANTMAEFINELEAGTYVLIGIKDEGSKSMTEIAYQALESIGSKLCRNVNYRDSWAIIGIKGAPTGSVKEQHTPRYRGIAVVQDTIVNYYTHGSIMSASIGPAAAWKSVYWGEYLPVQETNIFLDVFGFNKKSAVWDTLLMNLTNNTYKDLSTIKAKDYPVIKLAANLSSDDGLHTPFLKDWTVVYDPVPDLATGPRVITFSADTISQGENITISASIYNVGMATADSAIIRFSYNHSDSGKISFCNDRVLTKLEQDSFQTVIQTWNSTGKFGKNQISIELDPDNQVNELTETNNFFSKQVVVLSDTTAPEIKITFDNRQIVDGEYVAAQPVIQINVYDNNPVPIENDTAKIHLFLDGNRITYSNNENNLLLIPLNNSLDSTLKAQLQFTPLLSDGDHTLEVFVTDPGENSIYQRRNFKVVSELNILDVLNYPNPFRDNTYFTYFLTQTADNVTIKIYTVAGRLIRKIEYVSGEIGFNKVLWNGLDQDYDKLANGVYLYKIIVRLGDKQCEAVEKLVIMK